MRAMLKVIVGALFLAIASTTLATTYTVTRFDDPAPTPCTTLNCSLRSAVLAANAHAGRDVISLREGEYRLTLTGTNGGSLKVTGSLAIDGIGADGTHIRAANGARVFEVQSATLNLYALVLLEGHASGQSFPSNAGGCIFAQQSRVALTDVTIANCIAGDGGAVYLDTGQLELDHTSIRLNRAYNGGGVAIDGADTRMMLVDRSRIERNDATFGGGVYARGGIIDGGTGVISHPVRVELSGDSAVDSNDAEYGGAFANEWESGLDVALAAADAVHAGPLGMIEDNTASSLGGAILNLGTLSLHRMRLFGNIADAGGGAIESSKAIVRNFPTSVLTIEDSEFIENRATHGSGGGIEAYSTELTLRRVMLQSNYATFDIGDGGTDKAGGGIYTHGTGSVDLENVSLYANRAANHGGGIATDGVPVSLRSTTFLSNTVTSALTSARDIGMNTPLTTRNTIFTGGCYPGSHVSLGGNVQAGAGSCGLSVAAGDKINVVSDDLVLSAHTFGGSIDVLGTFVPNTPEYDFHVGACPLTDARGAVRPAACDSGAFEFIPTP